MQNLNEHAIARFHWTQPFYRPCFFLLSFTFCLVIGCADTTSQSNSSRQRQDAALQDPMGYNTKDVPTVTGNEKGKFDRKALDNDVNRFLNP